VNVLFVAGSAPDYLQDVLFHGLVSVLGADAVTEVPENPRYHGALPDPGRPMHFFDLPRRDRPDLAELVRAADAIVIASARDSALAAVREVLRLRGTIPTAFVDGEDDPYVRGIAASVDVYFKRETLRAALRLRARMPLRRLYYRRRRPDLWEDPLTRAVAVASARTRGVVPLPFAIIDDGLAPAAAKDVDVAFLASSTDPVRAAVADAVGELAGDGIVVRSAGDLDHAATKDWHAYMDVLSRSRIGISVRGLGFDTIRYWEVPYAGALLLAETPRTVIPGNFVDGREAFFAPVDRLAQRARELLAGDTSRIAAAGREALLARHTSVQRAEAVLGYLSR
jgi:Glycosyl transferases group 1